MKSRILPYVVLVAGLATPHAAAASANIPFSGVLANACVVNVVSGGDLGVSSNYRIIASGQPGGSLGQAIVTATGPGFTLGVDQPTAFDSAPGDDSAPTTFLARYRASGATNIGSLTSADRPLNRGVTDVRVHLRASKSGVETFAAGDYVATVLLRCE